MNDKEVRANLEYIRCVMQSLRRRNAIQGMYYLIWGIVIPLCTALSWWMESAGYGNFIGINWIVGMSCGAVCCAVVGWSRSRSKDSSKVRSGEIHLYYTSWILFSVTSLLTILVGWVFGRFSVQEGLFILSLLLATAYAFDAAYSGLYWLFAVAVGWLLVGCIGLWLPLQEASRLFGFATLPLELIPGLLLNRMYRKERDGTA